MIPAFVREKPSADLNAFGVQPVRGIAGKPRWQHTSSPSRSLDAVAQFSARVVLYDAVFRKDLHFRLLS